MGMRQAAAATTARHQPGQTTTATSTTATLHTMRGRLSLGALTKYSQRRLRHGGRSYSYSFLATLHNLYSFSSWLSARLNAVLWAALRQWSRAEELKRTALQQPAGNSIQWHHHKHRHKCCTPPPFPHSPLINTHRETGRNKTHFSRVLFVILRKYICDANEHIWLWHSTRFTLLLQSTIIASLYISSVAHSGALYIYNFGEVQTAAEPSIHSALVVCVVWMWCACILHTPKH